MGGVTQGYPRFGIDESGNGELTYIILDPDASYAAANEKTWEINGAATLFAGIVTTAALLLAF